MGLTLSTVLLGKKNTNALRIAFREDKREGQGVAATEVSTTGAVVDGPEDGSGPKSECF